MNSHYNVKSHVCDFIMANGEICGQGFVRRSGLLRHKRGHSIGKDIKCLVCDQFFTYWSNMKQHCEKVHKSLDRFWFFVDSKVSVNFETKVSSFSYLIFLIKAVNRKNISKVPAISVAVNSITNTVYRSIWPNIWEL